MKDQLAPRVMWLLNHTTLRKFEVDQLKRLGVSSVFTPKSFPYDEGNLSASVTYEFDHSLGINPSELAVLNSQNWYGEPSSEAWEIANREFDIVFIGFFLKQIESACNNFRGAIVMRAFGLGGTVTYSKTIGRSGENSLYSAIQKAGVRFWFGMGYEHLSLIEDRFLADRAIHLPVGLKAGLHSDSWVGGEKSVLFVCPRIGSSPYYASIYRRVKEEFCGYRLRIVGAQPIFVPDSDVLGFVSSDQYIELMTRAEVMFYHSQEPNHIHYHPFEAVDFGMPLVFMAGGMLDRMGGVALPGRCVTYVEARRKINRIFARDGAYIEKVRTSQKVLLDAVDVESCQKVWRDGFGRIVRELSVWRAQGGHRPKCVTATRIAIILPAEYRGGSLRGAIAIANAVLLGSSKSGDLVEVVFAHLDSADSYNSESLSLLSSGVTRRSFRWSKLSAEESRRAMRYAGNEVWEPTAPFYLVPDDGVAQFIDCDLWLVVSDRLFFPLLPIRPFVLMVYDYLQRYEDLLSAGADKPFIEAARSAKRVFVTTEFTQSCALQYAGVEKGKVRKVPMLVQDYSQSFPEFAVDDQTSQYFVWPTNSGLHKNHVNAAEALLRYYEYLDGQLDCFVTGVDTNELLVNQMPHLRAMSDVFNSSKVLQKRVKWLGELPDARYRSLLSKSVFLWHAGRMDNGTFCVVEAAFLGVPSLSSDYPAMREIDREFELELMWMSPCCPQEMAHSLKTMEGDAVLRRKKLPSRDRLQVQGLEKYAKTYWMEIRACL